MATLDTRNILQLILLPINLTKIIVLNCYCKKMDGDILFLDNFSWSIKVHNFNKLVLAIAWDIILRK